MAVVTASIQQRLPMSQRAGFARGFTLLELLIVVVIVGITLGMISYNAMPNTQQALKNEAQRVALLLQAARDEAIVRNRPVAFEASSEHYSFLVRNDTRWDTITDDDLMRERPFKVGPMSLLMDPPPVTGSDPLRIVFGREPVDKPFVLTLTSGDNSVAIHADGIGHFSVE